MDRVANIFKQLTGDQRFRIEGHITHRTARAIEMAGESQPIDAASTTGKDRRHTAHPEPNTQGPKGRAHGLRLVMRPARVISGELIHHFGFARSTRGSIQRFPPTMAGSAISSGSRRRRRGKRVHFPQTPSYTTSRDGLFNTSAAHISSMVAGFSTTPRPTASPLNRPSRFSWLKGAGRSGGASAT